jgi:hypothetical protein
MTRNVEQDLARLQDKDVEHPRIAYGELIIAKKALSDAHDRPFGYPRTPQGDAQKQLEYSMTFGLGLGYPVDPKQRANERSLLLRLTNNPEVLEQRDATRRDKLAQKALELDDFLSASNLEYYVAAKYVHASEEPMRTSVLISYDDPIVVARLAGFNVVDASSRVDSHIEPVVISKNDKTKQGLLPQHARLLYSPLYK